MKETYFIIRGSKAIRGSSVNSPCKTLEDVKEMLGYNPVYDILMEGDMYWVLGRVKGIKSPLGEITPYGEYEREYFNRSQIMGFRKYAIVDFNEIVELKDQSLSEAGVVCDAADDIYLSLLEQWGEFHEAAIKNAVESFYDCKIS